MTSSASSSASMDVEGEEAEHLCKRLEDADELLEGHSDLGGVLKEGERRVTRPLPVGDYLWSVWRLVCILVDVHMHVYEFVSSVGHGELGHLHTLYTCRVGSTMYIHVHDIDEQRW